MKYVILHKSDKRIRIKTPLLHMTYRQADLLEYFLKSIPEIKDASVDERTGNATILFQHAASDKERILAEALQGYDETSEEVQKLLPEETGRRLNREYQEKVLFKGLFHNMTRLFLPEPVRIARTIVKGVPFLCAAVKTVFSGKIRVEALDGTAIAASILCKDYSTASSIIFLLETGGILEEWTRKKSIGDLARSMALNIDQVWVRTEKGEICLPVNKVKAGDLVVVRSSDIIPLDGRVVSGSMTVNQSSMTGESLAVMKGEGGYVYAGTVVEEGECLIEVAKEAGRGKYDQIVRMIEASEKLKSSTEENAYRLADALVPYSFAGFGLTYAFTRNITKALAFLMVDYSCAMKLAMPVAVLSAINEAGEYGITIKGGKFMERVSEADTIVFDKTGTITYSVPKLKEVVVFGDNDPDEMLRVAACLEEHYPHSVANAIVNGALEKGLKHDELHSKVAYIVAHGVSSFIEGKKAVIGSYHFVIEDEGCTIPAGEEYKLDEIGDEYSKMYLAMDGVLSAVLCIHDPVRQEAADVVRTLHELGIKRVCMMTGDNRKTAKCVAEQIGIDDYEAEVLPEEKALFVKKLREKGAKVLMVGDGVNDSPALSEADVGIAMDSGAAIAREIADITITAESLYSIVMLRRVSRALMNRISGNYRFIVGFNTMLITLGLTGLLSPSSSALFHNGSTILSGIKSTGRLLDTGDQEQ